ncbi:peroxidasin homolog pxn-2-like isoform X2 [Aphidius gifuensis]|uniref:peroxidasin homolog pxn-2-like isoform X2 n=1 Tax=Aphidius gifuensis TaxID=684658 RepID=UPI001CDD7977|nr:peroxidasin homolog pxn-2-like isoform X2 [Aphidius gifuensis]XP_044018998.1 peroxidasin homolog pxn-2-like isoform X2 [Aphidius gifuensis]
MFYCICWMFFLMALIEGTILPQKMLQELDKKANETMNKYKNTEELILNSKIKLNHESPSWYLGVSHDMSEEAGNLSLKALRSETMAIMLVEALKMSPNDALTILPSMSLSQNICKESLTNIKSQYNCKIIDKKYRTHNGKCNNPFNKNWGSSLEAYTRFLSPQYQDGVSLPNINLPSSRLISKKIHSGNNDYRHPYLMAITSLFGQFIFNDISHTPKIKLTNGERLKCCDVDYKYFHSECFPIQADNNIGCMEYSRSAPHPGNSLKCKLGPREQINQATSYLDLSPIYGTNDNISKILRLNKAGLLNTQHNKLPMALKNFDYCRNKNKAFPCFLSGDTRINEHPGIALMHILFLREHNRVAEQLSKLNSHWNDEKLYQEARKIVIAEVQHITYNEFLPAVFGDSNLDRFDLELVKSGYFTGYDTRIDATVSNAGASVGLLFIAALTPKTLDLIDSGSSSKSGERILLSSFYAPQELYEAGAIDRLISGATAGHSRQPLPPSLNEVLLDRYFHDGKTSDNAVDYAAQLIQQGRDHGLPSYTHWRSFCDLTEVKNFHDLESTMSNDTITRIEKVYRNVEDIDLVTGALSEIPVEGSVMGPTFACLLGQTFRNIRLGDRYWYENGLTPGSFTLKQLDEIRKSTMARILCNNGDRLKRIQPRAFLLKDPFLNEVADCKSYQDTGMNLTLWKEQL